MTALKSREFIYLELVKVREIGRVQRLKLKEEGLMKVCSTERKTMQKGCYAYLCRLSFHILSKHVNTAISRELSMGTFRM